MTGFWFNPNIHPFQEYKLRLDSLKWLAHRQNIDIYFSEEYNPADFLKLFNAQSKDLTELRNIENPDNPEHLLKSPPPSSERCRSCYRLRLEKTAEQASKEGFDAFSTTLLISPYQGFEDIVKTGQDLAEKFNIFFYLRDFRPFFRKSLAEAKELGIYRQKYCGCIYSKEEKKQAQRHREKNFVTSAFGTLCLLISNLMQDNLQYIGKFLIILGIVSIIIGALFLLFRHTDIPLPGKLPGDIVIKRKSFTIYLPIATSIILSILLSMVLYFISGRK